MAQSDPGDIILLGVIHNDPKGYKRTADFLAGYRPDLVLIEISPFALRYRSENAPRLYRELRNNLKAAAKKAEIPYLDALKLPRIVRIGRQIHLPFEYRASAAWRRESGAELVAVDRSEFSRRWIATWPELISAQNLETLLRLGDTPLDAAPDYGPAASAILGAPLTEPALDPEEALARREREEHIAAQIRSRIEMRNPARPLYIGGWRHLVHGGMFRTVRDILGTGIQGCFLLDRGPVSTGT